MAAKGKNLKSDLGVKGLSKSRKEAQKKIQALMGLEDVTYKKTKMGTISNMT